STVNYGSTAMVYSGSKAIAFSVTKPWGGLYLHSDSGTSMTGYGYLTFAARASGGSGKYGVRLLDSNDQ
ncbi:MAG: hypothetical protein ACR2PL_25640, partial [Dehalococcoidia bacterium]